MIASSFFCLSFLLFFFFFLLYRLPTFFSLRFYRVHADFDCVIVQVLTIAASRVLFAIVRHTISAFFLSFILCVSVSFFRSFLPSFLPSFLLFYCARPPRYHSYADATGHAPMLRDDAMLFWQSRDRYKVLANNTR